MNRFGNSAQGPSNPAYEATGVRRERNRIVARHVTLNIRNTQAIEDSHEFGACLSFQTGKRLSLVAHALPVLSASSQRQPLSVEPLEIWPHAWRAAYSAVVEGTRNRNSVGVMKTSARSVSPVARLQKLTACYVLSDETPNHIREFGHDDRIVRRD